MEIKSVNIQKENGNAANASFTNEDFTDFGRKLTVTVSNVIIYFNCTKHIFLISKSGLKEKYLVILNKNVCDDSQL